MGGITDDGTDRAGNEVAGIDDDAGLGNDADVVDDTGWVGAGVDDTGLGVDSVGCAAIAFTSLGSIGPTEKVRFAEVVLFAEAFLLAEAVLLVEVILLAA